MGGGLWALREEMDTDSAHAGDQGCECPEGQQEGKGGTGILQGFLEVGSVFQLRPEAKSWLLAEGRRMWFDVHPSVCPSSVSQEHLSVCVELDPISVRPGPWSSRLTF